VQRRLQSEEKGFSPGPEAWLSRAGSQCLRCWERWLSPARRRVTAHVRSVRHARVLGRVVLRSALALPFHIALVFLPVSAVLLQGAYSHTEKHMRGQRMRQKIASREGRTSSVFAPYPLADAPCFREIGRMAFCAQVSLQSVRHRSGCEARKAASATRQCHSQPFSVLASAAGHYAC